MRLTTIILAAIVAASPAFATVEPTPEPEPPAPPPVVVDRPEDGDSAYESYGRIYYSVCTCDKMKVAWGFESLELRTNKARMQCDQRRERISCPMKWK